MSKSSKVTIQIEKTEEILNKYYLKNPVEEHNSLIEEKVNAYNVWVESLNKEIEDKKLILDDQYKQIRELKNQASEIDKGLKERNSSANKTSKDLVDKYNDLISEYNNLVNVYRKDQDSFNSQVVEIERKIETRKKELDDLQNRSEQEIKKYQDWLQQDGRTKFFNELNILYASLIEEKRKSASISNLLNQEVDRLKDIRNEIGIFTQKQQDRIENGALVVQVVLCGNEKSYLTVDTGASVVSITNEMVKILNIEDQVGDDVELTLAGGIHIKAPQLLIPKISFNEYEAKFIKAVVLKNSFPGVDGSLGLSFLNRFNYRIERDNPHQLILMKEKSSTSVAGYDIFISYNTDDLKYAREIYELLVQSNYNPFLSEISLGISSTTEFQKEIDTALESAKHLIVICSSCKNVMSAWVEAEWRVFDYLKKSGKKKGNIVPIICGQMTLEELPVTLKRYNVLSMEQQSWRSTLVNFLPRDLC